MFIERKDLDMPIKVGFIGTGGISGAHRRHLKQMDDVAVVAMCDLDEARAAEAAEEWGAQVFTDYRAMLEGARSQSMTHRKSC